MVCGSLVFWTKLRAAGSEGLHEAWLFLIPESATSQGCFQSYCGCHDFCLLLRVFLFQDLPSGCRHSGFLLGV